MSQSCGLKSLEELQEPDRTLEPTAILMADAPPVAIIITALANNDNCCRQQGERKLWRAEANANFCGHQAQ